MVESRTAILFLLACCCLGILGVTFLLRSGGSGERDPIVAVDGSPEADTGLLPPSGDETPRLDWVAPDASARTEEATIESCELLADRFEALRALPEGTLEEMTTKLEAFQATVRELSPPRSSIRIKPGFDWKAHQRSLHPELWAAKDDVYRLQNLVREKRYAEYLAGRG